MDENHDGKISQLEFIEVGFCFFGNELDCENILLKALEYFENI